MQNFVRCRLWLGISGCRCIFNVILIFAASTVYSLWWTHSKEHFESRVTVFFKVLLEEKFLHSHHLWWPHLRWGWEAKPGEIEGSGKHFWCVGAGAVGWGWHAYKCTLRYSETDVEPCTILSTLDWPSIKGAPYGSGSTLVSAEAKWGQRGTHRWKVNFDVLAI